MIAPKYQSWLAYIKARQLANSISRLARVRFPKYERFSLTDQIRRSSRSVGANLAESAAKVGYQKYFRAKLTDARSENYETQHWLLVALDEAYISQEEYEKYLEVTDEVGRLLTYMLRNPNQFLPNKL